MSASGKVEENTVTTDIKAVLFDLDGTLLDTEKLSDRALLKCIAVLTKSNNIPDSLPWELKKKILGLRGAEWGPIVLEYVHDTWNIPTTDLPSVAELWKSWETNLSELCSEVTVCDGAVQLIKALVQHSIPMAIATSSRQSSVASKRTNHNDTIFQHISVIVTGDDVTNGKPAPDIYIKAAKLLNVDPRNCLVFEDALSGVRSGKAAGCTVVAIPDPRFSDTEKSIFYEEADVVLNTLNEFTTNDTDTNQQQQQSSSALWKKFFGGELP